MTFVLRPFDGSTGGGVVKHLYVAENGVCKISTFILKAYIATTIPHIESFNGVSITLDEKERSSSVFKRILGFSTSEHTGNTTQMPFDPLLDGRNGQNRSSLESFSTGLCFQENAWTTNVYDQSVINYAVQLQENSYGLASSELDHTKKPVDKPPPPHSFPSVSVELSKKGNDQLSRGEMSLQRGDIEYRYPYKSSSAHSAPMTTFSSFAPLLPSQQSNISSISNIIQLVLQRRSIEEKFCEVKY